MATTMLKNERISGVEVEVHVDTRTGMFRVLAKDGETLSHDDSMDGAIRKARPKVAQRKAKIAIPFISRAGEHGVATGVHSRNRTILARVDDTAVQLDYHGREAFRGDTPPETIERYLLLADQIKAAKAEQAEIEMAHGIDLNKEVQRALAEAAAEAMAAEDEAR